LKEHKKEFKKMTKKEMQFKIWVLQQTIASYDDKILMSRDANHIELLKSNQEKIQNELYELIKEYNKIYIGDTK
jgi:hypothetical protein